MKNRKTVVLILYIAVLILLFSWVTGAFSNSRNAVPYSEVIKLFQGERVKEFVLQGKTMNMRITQADGKDTILSTTIADPEGFLREMQPLLESQIASGVLTSYDVLPEKGFNVFELVLPLILAGVALLFLWAMLMGKANSQNPLNSFGKARTVLGIPNGKKVTFADVAGADEEKQELEEIVDFLRAPEK